MSCYGPLVNVSSSGLSQKHETMVHWLLAAISLTVSPFTITLNALVIIAVTQRKELQKRSNILLSSIALADFLTGIASIPAVTTSLVTVHEVSLKLVCAINRVALSLEDFLRFCSLCHLTMVAWERFVAIRKSMDYKVIMTKSFLTKIAIFAWLSAIFTWLPLFIMLTTSVEVDLVRVGILIINVFGVILVVFILYFYAMVYHEVRKRRTSDIRLITAQLQAKRESNVAKTTGLITAALLLTIALGNILPKVILLQFPALHLRFVFHISRTLVRLNSVLNPILYCYRDRRFRKAIKELLRIRKTQETQERDDGVRFCQRTKPAWLVSTCPTTVDSNIPTSLARSTSCDLPV